MAIFWSLERWFIVFLKVILHWSFCLQIKNAGDMNRGQHHGEGQVGAHMAMLLGGGKQQTLLGFLASPTEENTGRAVGAHVWVYTV